MKFRKKILEFLIRNNASEKKIQELMQSRDIFQEEVDARLGHLNDFPATFGYLGDLARMAKYAAGMPDGWRDTSEEIENFRFYSWNRYSNFLEILGRKRIEKSFSDFLQMLALENGGNDSLNWSEIWEFAAYISDGFEAHSSFS